MRLRSCWYFFLAKIHSQDGKCIFFVSYDFFVNVFLTKKESPSLVEIHSEIATEKWPLVFASREEGAGWRGNSEDGPYYDNH